MGKENKIRKIRTIANGFFYTFGVCLVITSPVSAELGPEGSEFAIADWLVLSFLVFFLFGLIVFLLAHRYGLFKNVEEAKYYILEIDEPDYYTPDWAKEEEEEDDSNRKRD